MQNSLFGNDQIPKPFTLDEIKIFKLKIAKEVKEYLQDTANYHGIDDNLISVYASSISDIRKYSAILDEIGELIPGKMGRLETNPYVQLKQKAFDNATKLADKLGILSINRKRLQGAISGSDESDDFAEFE